MDYKLELLAELPSMYPIFHVVLLKKCIGGLLVVLPLKSVSVKDSFYYKEVPIETLDRRVHKLRNKEVSLVKVLWRNQLVERSN